MPALSSLKKVGRGAQCSFMTPNLRDPSFFCLPQDTLGVGGSSSSGSGSSAPSRQANGDGARRTGVGFAGGIWGPQLQRAHCDTAQCTALSVALPWQQLVAADNKLP